MAQFGYKPVMGNLSFSPFVQKNIVNPTLGEVVGWMCKFSFQGKKDIKIRHLAEDIIKELQSGDYAGEAIAVHNWLCANFRYVRDIQGVEYIQWPQEGLARGTGDCDDSSVVAASLMGSIGARCEFVLAGFRNDGDPSHVFTRVKTPYGYLVIDPVANVEIDKMLHEITDMIVVPCDEGPDVDIGAAAALPFHGWGALPWR